MDTYLDVPNAPLATPFIREWNRFRISCCAALVLIGLVFGVPVFGHELRPAYLELKQTSAETYDVVWKVPVLGDLQSRLQIVYPANCSAASLGSESTVADLVFQRGALHCAGGLSGKVEIAGLSATSTDVLVRVQRINGSTQSVRLTPSSPFFTLESSPHWTQAAGTYLNLGIKHILLGFDHLLFVLGLLILVQRRWMLMLKTISAFTLAHSLTLVIATLRIVEIPSEPLNAIIALSILFLGVEVIRQIRGESSFTIERPWAAAFGFGLVHGFGFASGLSTLGLPPNEIVIALLFFNLGVELGQLLFVAGYLLFERSLRVLEVPAVSWSHLLPAYIIGTLGAYWTISSVWKFFE